MRLIILTILYFFGISAVSAANSAAPAPTVATNVTAILITASGEAGASDKRLAPYEATLRRILRFEGYRFVGQASGAVPGEGSVKLEIGAGHILAVARGAGDRLQVTWKQGDTTLMNTGLALRPGVPAVLGGPGTGKEGEVFAVIVTSR